MLDLIKKQVNPIHNKFFTICYSGVYLIHAIKNQGFISLISFEKMS